MDCQAPDCTAPATYESAGVGYCAEHADMAPTPEGLEPACWRYDPSDRSFYLFLPYAPLNGPDDPPDRKWPMFKLYLDTGKVLTYGQGTHIVAQAFWDGLAAALPADLGDQVTALLAQVADVGARYEQLVLMVGRLEESAERAAGLRPPQAPAPKLWTPPERRRN